MLACTKNPEDRGNRYGLSYMYRHVLNVDGSIIRQIAILVPIQLDTSRYIIHVTFE